MAHTQRMHSVTTARYTLHTTRACAEHASAARGTPIEGTRATRHARPHRSARPLLTEKPLKGRAQLEEKARGPRYPCFTGLRKLRLIKVDKPDHFTTFRQSTDHFSDGHRWGSPAGPDRFRCGSEGSRVGRKGSKRCAQGLTKFPVSCSLSIILP